MHDCPTCGVPLHGHEEVCPSCGARQHVRRGAYHLEPVQKAPGVNMMPVIVIAVVTIGALVFFAQSNWIGELMRHGPTPEDPMEKITYAQARDIIEQKLNEGLTAVGATGKFEWKSGDAPADKAVDQQIQLNIETTLSDPNQRKAIIDPVKEDMEKAKINTLTMNDTKSHATWTYSVQPASEAPAEGEPAAE
jgi:hypothetical protein